MLCSIYSTLDIPSLRSLLHIIRLNMHYYRTILALTFTGIPFSWPVDYIYYILYGFPCQKSVKGHRGFFTLLYGARYIWPCAVCVTMYNTTTNDPHRYI